MNKPKIKTKDLDPNKMMLKAEYARRQGVSHTEVNRMIKRGQVTIVELLGGAQIIHL